MYAYVALLIGAQAALAWSFNSHVGGEEQALFGLLDHDGTPSWKVGEFARIASEFKQLSKLGFPRYTRPEVAIAYSFDSFIASDPNGQHHTAILQIRLYPAGSRSVRALVPREHGRGHRQYREPRPYSLQARHCAGRLRDGCRWRKGFARLRERRRYGIDDGVVRQSRRARAMVRDAAARAPERRLRPEDQ